jgi:Tfp pilus assembly major pilin PilA
MNIRLSLLATCIAVAALILGPVSSHGASKKKKPETPAVDTSDRITAVHLGSITVTVFANHMAKEYQVTPATRITVNGAPATRNNLATGMSVVVTAADGRTAETIDAKSPTPPGSK